MCCRLHGYPTAPLISYKIPGIGTLWEVAVPLCRLSTTPCAGSESGSLCAQFTQQPMRTGHYLVACPALNEREEVSDCYTAADICYAMYQESGHTPTLKTIWGTPTWNTGNACDTFRTGLHLGASPPGCV